LSQYKSGKQAVYDLSVSSYGKHYERALIKDKTIYLYYIMKNIIYVWTLNPCNYTSSDSWAFWGIGDIIRGIISVMIICEKNNYKFHIDFSLCEINKYLIYKKHDYENHVKLTSKNIIFFPINGQLNEYMIKQQDPVLLMTNEIYNKRDITERIKTEVKNIFTKNKEFDQYYNKIMDKLNIKKGFSIIHFRLGDDMLVRGNNNIEETLNDYYKKYLLNKEDNQLVLSDNILFRNFLRKNEKNINLFDTENIVHIGRNNNKSIKDTLVEFFLILESKFIKTFSVYGWTSGFVLYPSIINNIPLQEI